MKRTLNIKLFLILMGTGIAVSAALFLVHHLQAGRIANALLWQAQRAEQEERLDQAAKYLDRFLEFRPQDTEQRARLGCLLAGDKLALSPRARDRAVLVLEQVITRQPDRHDLRRLVVRLAMDLRPPRLELAREHLDALRQALPADGEVARLLGAYYEMVKDDAQAMDWYRKAVRYAPTQIDSYVRLAGLLRGQLKQAAQADKVMDDLVTANGQAFQAYLERGRYRLQNGVLVGAFQDVERARQLAPDAADVLLASAEMAQARKNVAQARTFLERGVQLHPRDSRFYHTRAQLEVTDEKPEQAIACLQDSVKVVSGQAQADLLWTLGNLLIDTDHWQEAEEKAIVPLSKAGQSPATVSYLQARILVGKKEWAEAGRLLERTRLTLESAATPNKELLDRVDLFLAMCYEQQAEPTRQLDACRRVVARDPASVPGRLGVAAALRALGRFDEAIAQLQPIAQQPQVGAVRWLELAHLRIERSLVRGTGDWTDVEDALQRAEKAQPGMVEVTLLRAQVLAAQNKLAAAAELLAKAWKEQPKKIELATALAGVFEAQREPEKALALLDELQKQQGDSAVLRLARARYWVNRHTHDAAAEVAKLGQDVEKFKDEKDQALLLQGLGEAAHYLGDLKTAERLWTRLAETPHYKKDPRIRLVLLDLARQTDDDACMRQILEAIQAIEGGQGPMTKYATALRLIWLAKPRATPGTDEGRTVLDEAAVQRLDEARALLDQVAAQRSTWPAVLLAKAEIDVLRGNPEQAIDNYRKALELGEPSPRVVRPLVQLLYQCQRYGEADQEIRRLQKQALPADLNRIAAEVSLLKLNRDPRRAMQQALEAVSAGSTDYRDYLWLGQVLAASDPHSQEAEKQLRWAVQLADTVPETWVALVQFLVNAGRKAEAQTAIAQAQSRVTPDKAPLALAQCHEAIGRLDLAEKHYQLALAARPDDALVLRSAAGFSMRAGRPQDAEPHLRKLVERKVKASDWDVSWARRGLAMVLTSSSDYRRFREALPLVGLTLDSAGRVVDGKPPAIAEPVEEQRARARVLATRKSRLLRKKAIGLLEDLDRRHPLTADDRFLLVQLYEAEGAWSKASDQLEALMRRQGPKPLYFVHYAQGLLRQHDVDRAERVIGDLERLEKEQKVEPGALGTLDLKVQVLKARDQHEQAIALLKAHINRPGAKPEEVVMLIGYLARLKRLAPALDLCQRCWETCPPAVAGGASMAVLRAGQPTDEQCARVERWLKTAAAKDPQATALLLHLADLADLRGRFQEAEAVYGEVLKREPLNVVALNNLSWLLAQRSDDGAAALPLINRALDAYGPSPELLDTRAVVHLALNETKEAIADLEHAIAQDAATGARCFHLARAHHKANNADAAARAFRQAKDLGLRRQHLHPIEQQACGRVFDELEQR
jgi:tetratricopeptide (TPR) repeat protein